MTNNLRKDFAVFILTHGRPNKMLTLDTLKKCNYTGKWYLIVDDEDKTIGEYIEKYGKDKVIVFDKYLASKTFDICDTFSDRRAVVYARNACFTIAEKLGLSYFLQLDDDYTEFRFRIEKDGVLKSIYCRHIDEVFEAMLEFLDVSNCKTVALAQTGDFIGGTGSNVFKKKLPRKAMNSFFCKTSNKFQFIGRINEDVNTYVNLGCKGELMFTVAECSLDQLATQQNKGGLTDIYLNLGTYVKSFYTVIVNPSCTKIGLMGCSDKRIHHKILWNYCTPKIISEKYKKHN